MPDGHSPKMQLVCTGRLVAFSSSAGSSPAQQPLQDWGDNFDGYWLADVAERPILLAASLALYSHLLYELLRVDACGSGRDPQGWPLLGIESFAHQIRSQSPSLHVVWARMPRGTVSGLAERGHVEA